MSSRRPRLDAVITAAQKAGVEIARVEVRPDGTIVLTAGQPEAQTPIDTRRREVRL